MVSECMNNCFFLEDTEKKEEEGILGAVTPAFFFFAKGLDWLMRGEG